MTETVDRVRRQCLALGMDAGEPLAALLLGLAEGQDETKRLIEEASHKIGSGANALSPDGEKALVDRLGKEAARVMNIHAVQYLRAGSLRTVLVASGVLVGAMVLAGGGGYWWGHSAARADIRQTEAGLVTAFANGPEAAREWWSLMAWNDPRKALANCRVHIDGGRRACDLPMWIEGPQAPGPGR